jgi:hypothetical protein
MMIATVDAQHGRHGRPLSLQAGCVQSRRTSCGALGQRWCRLDRHACILNRWPASTMNQIKAMR